MLNTMSTILNINGYSFVAYNGHKVEMLLNHYYYYTICLLSRVSEMVSDNNGNFIELFSFWDTNNCKSRLFR